MVITSFEQLQKALQDELKQALEETARKSEQDMKEAIDYFYSGGTPKLYERTGKMEKTPKTTPVSVSGNGGEFKAYLDQSGGYSTGKNPSMGQVLDLTNDGHSDGLRPAVGHTGYWDKAEQAIGQDFDDIMRKHFK